MVRACDFNQTNGGRTEQDFLPGLDGPGTGEKTVLEPEACEPGLPLSRAGRGQLNAVLRLLYVLLLHLVFTWRPFF